MPPRKPLNATTRDKRLNVRSTLSCSRRLSNSPPSPFFSLSFLNLSLHSPGVRVQRGFVIAMDFHQTRLELLAKSQLYGIGIGLKFLTPRQMRDDETQEDFHLRVGGGARHVASAFRKKGTEENDEEVITVTSHIQSSSVLQERRFDKTEKRRL